MFSHLLKIIFLLSLSLLGYVEAQEVTPNKVDEISQIDDEILLESDPSANKKPYIIRDIRTLPQDATVYLNPTCSSQALILPENHRALNAEFDRKFFAPWQQLKPNISKAEYLWHFSSYSNNLGFGENQKQHSPEWLKQLTTLAHLEDYPNTNRQAITITNTYLRLLPTAKPHFHTENSYPFDTLQNSAIWANTPLFIAHISQDQSWVLAESPLVEGWIPIEDIAFVDEAFINKWLTNKYVVITQDQVPLYGKNQLFRFKTHIGALFPYVGENATHYDILMATVNNETRQAVIEKTQLLKTVSALKPITVLPINLAKMINQLLTQPYGWGGLYEDRDCSSTLHDLFTPFGLWLPRNSATQSRIGELISLENLTPTAKEQKIVNEAIPYLTLLWKPGHIMLYLGTYQDKAIMFHNFWSIRTKNEMGERERTVVGQASITSLQPGIELKNIDAEKGNYLNNLKTMNIFVPSDKLQSCKK
ncbi:NLP/P60 protein [Thioploca ingrica]|uniref:NLP/P60 protein n=1 Tax=Thioploca ingrica TaxID=40754 RepID=A0A090ALD4_9GAMM|nr:NLP/P60 protein [Thioploca ingrica]